MTQTKNRYSKPKFLATFGTIILLLSGISHLFGLSTLKPTDADLVAKIAEAPATDDSRPTLTTDTTPQYIEEIEMDDTDSEMEDETDTDSEAEDTSDTDSCTSCQGSDAVFTSAKVWSYPACFPDSNSVQMVAARNNGVAPMNGRNEVMICAANNQLSNISSSPYYIIDDLTHSMPYLVPKAQRLLNTIGINFVDSLHSKGLPLHLPIVTSVLRTNDDIRRLQHGNTNSISNSCHCYGTTIDITYNRFMPLQGNKFTRYDDTLKKVLAEVLYDLRADGRCYVKYERRQACFHLTVI